LASTKKERTSSNPDYTVGTLATYHNGWLYVKDVIRGRWSARKRDPIIVNAAEADGPETHVKQEATAAYVDTYDYLKALLEGHVVVEKFLPKVDKFARATLLEPMFEGGHVGLLQAPWNEEWLLEVGGFPFAEHDDRVDSLVCAVYDLIKGRRPRVRFV
jgi:predicted phage terminase large subunit-like protein